MPFIATEKEGHLLRSEQRVLRSTLRSGIAMLAFVLVNIPLAGLLALALVPCSPTHAGSLATQALEQEGFGTLSIHSPGTAPKGIVLLLTDRSGVDADIESMAAGIVGLNFLVVVVDSKVLLAGSTESSSPPDTISDRLGRLAISISSRFQLPRYAPVLMGYGEGAAIVYSALGQGQPGTFHAGISLDFCPGLAAPPGPETHLAATWFIFQRHAACADDAVSHFISHLDNAELTVVSADKNPATGTQDQWPQLTALMQWLDPRIVGQVDSANVSGVPLIELPAPRDSQDNRLAIMVSGDGGWAELDKSVAAELGKRGVAVLGWNSLKYFWRERTPEGSAADLERVLRHYIASWHRTDILLVGYSFGANVLPFMANRLPPDLQGHIRLVAMMGPEKTAAFVFHLTDWLGDTSGSRLPLLPEVQRLDWTKRLCLYGDQEKSSLCPDLASQDVLTVKLPGDHHFNKDYATLADKLLAQ